MSTNQKLREALQELIEAYNRAGPGLSRAERAVDRLRLIAAHEAIALPTAAPVEERELPPLPGASFTYERRPGGFSEPERVGAYTADQMRAYARAALQSGADAKDAERYRWLRDEAWAGYNQGKGFPHVFTVDGAGNRRTMLAEDALDDAIDAAIARGKEE